MPRIDRTRPLMENLNASGGSVIMYFDSPGVYYNAGGHEVGTNEAREMGMDVDAHLKLKEVQAYKVKQAEELAAFEQGQNQEAAAAEQEILEEGLQKVDRSAYPNLEPMGFDEYGQLRETKTLICVGIDGKENLFNVAHKVTDETVVASVDGANAVRSMLTWHEDHPEAAAAEVPNLTPKTEVGEIEDLFGQTVK